VDPGEKSILIQESGRFRSGPSLHDWRTPGKQARITVTIDDFAHGEVLVTIKDGSGALLHGARFRSLDGPASTGDWRKRESSITAEGEAGDWTVALEYEEFSGSITILADTDLDLATDPVADPPGVSPLLDPAFGEGGRAVLATAGSSAREIALDPAGRIVIAGTAVDRDGFRRLAVRRILSDGAADPAFAGGGAFALEGPSPSGATSVAVDAAGRILAAGWRRDASGRTDMLLIRLTAAGALDGSFGSDGTAALDDGGEEIGTDVAVDSAGRVLVTGFSRDAAGGMILARLDGSGVPDATFGTGGLVRTGNASDRGLGLGVDGANRPVVVGFRDGGSIAWRFNETGAADPAFGSGGVAVSAAGGEVRIARSVAVAGDGSLALTGVRIAEDGSSPAELVIWRLNSGGTPLAAFDGNGFLAAPFAGGTSLGCDLAFDSLGRILVSGSTRTEGSGEGSAATLWRFSATGAADIALPGGETSAGASRFEVLPGGASSAASALVLDGVETIYAAGGAFAPATGGMDLVAWKLRH